MAIANAKSIKSLFGGTSPGQTPGRLRAGFFAFAKRTRKESPASSSPALPAGYRHRSHNLGGTCLLQGRASGKKAHPAPLRRYALKQIPCNGFDATYRRDTPCGSPGTGNSQRHSPSPCIAANLPSSGRKGDRLRWKEPAGDFMANSCRKWQ